ncbi:major facilitator superfamily domain-containing protein [Lipomyces doorenjongii]|uniref:major facilitator superfamily domain-containing protein n=1 Tax=Lipomyces doorenjongii TaxID=383834 RepID=UPI0034CEE152
MSELKDNLVAEAALVSSSSQPPQKAKPTAPVSAWNVLVQGIALFSDGYNVQIMGYMETVMAKLYPKQLTSSIKTLGEAIGMLLFGLCIDRFGRRVGIIATTAFLVLVRVRIILSTAAHGNTVTGMFWMMIVPPPESGVGAGDEYAVWTAQALECADSRASLQKRRGSLVSISANLATSIVSLIFIAAYGNKASEGILRACFGIGIFLPLTIFFVRMSLLDSSLYQKHAIQHRVPYMLAIRRYWRPLLGCSLAWFLYDFVAYPFNLLAPTLVSGFTKTPTLLQSVGWSALINSFAIPGAIFGGWLTDRMGRRQTYAVGGLRFPLSHVFPLFVVLYGFFQSFLSVGPADCNFLVSSESFPTPLRGHFLGFAAAVGKASSAIGTTVLIIALNSLQNQTKGHQVLFFIGSSISVLGTMVVIFLIPNHPATLEEEDSKFRAYLEENGYDASEMGLVEKH